MVARFLNLAIAAAIAAVVVGCGTPKSETMDAAAVPKPTPVGQTPGKAAPGMIDDFSVNPAPPGVNTGTPGEGGK